MLQALGFGGPDRGEIDRLRMRIEKLERTVTRQQQAIDMLMAELGMETSSLPASLRPDPDILHPEVIDLLRQHKEIAAIKRHRELTGAGLREAKELIDREKGKYL